MEVAPEDLENGYGSTIRKTSSHCRNKLLVMKLIQLTTQPADALFSRVQVARELSGLLFVRSEIDCSQVEK